jgi:hypothetical protein
MANLQSIMAETSKSYDNSRNALNNQINAIAGDLEAQKNRINAQYAQQGKTLDNQRNYQAQASSMAASRNGGSFGGSAEIANKKYYQQAYVPAVTQMQTNQANDLSSAESQANQNRLSLQQSLAQLNDEANRYALQRYDAAVQAEREEAARQQQLAEQRRQFNASLAAQNAYQKYLTGNSTPANKYGVSEDASGGLQFRNNNTNNSVKFGTYYGGNGGTWSNSAILNTIGDMFGRNSNEFNRMSEIMKYNSKKKLSNAAGNIYNYGNMLSSSDADLLNRLGLRLG